MYSGSLFAVSVLEILQKTPHPENSRLRRRLAKGRRGLVLPRLVAAPSTVLRRGSCSQLHPLRLRDLVRPARGGQKPRATRALALGVSRFFPYCSYCSTKGSSLAARFDPLLALGVDLAPVRHCGQHLPHRKMAPDRPRHFPLSSIYDDAARPDRGGGSARFGRGSCSIGERPRRRGNKKGLRGQRG
jgi:hypothetical protein